MRAAKKNSKILQNNGIIKFKKCGQQKEQQKTTKQWNFKVKKCWQQKRTAKDYKTME